MTYTLSQLTQEIGLEYHGKDIDIDGLHTLSEATPSQISFFNDKKYAAQLENTQAGAVLIDEGWLATHPGAPQSDCLPIRPMPIIAKPRRTNHAFVISARPRVAAWRVHTSNSA